MRISRCLYLMALVFGLCGLAKADPVDFKMTVLDAPTLPPTFSVTPVDGSPFFVNFGGCQSFSPAPPPNTPDGCFYFTNVSNVTLTVLTLDFANTVGLAGQTPNCDTSGTGVDLKTAFGASSCTGPTQNDEFYNLEFFGGAGVTPDVPGSMPMIYTIQEFGTDPSNFPTDISATLTATPEPNSVLLLGTGVLMMGGAFFLNRRRGFIG